MQFSFSWILAKPEMGGEVHSQKTWNEIVGVITALAEKVMGQSHGTGASLRSVNVSCAIYWPLHVLPLRLHPYVF